MNEQHNNFLNDIDERIRQIREQGLWREIRRIDSEQSSRILCDGKVYLNFSSNDYLGLASHPALKEAVINAIDKYGAGSGASRLICGSIAPHNELEELIAEFKGVEKAITFSSGYTTAVGTIPAIVEKGDIVIIDRLAHASLVDGARLSGAKLRVFPHNDVDALERILKRARSSTETDKPKRILIVTESVFSMDGDCAPLREIVAVKNKYGGWLMVDEAHSTGLFGQNRAGLISELGLTEEVEIQMGTLGKAIGASGGFICGKKALIEFLINKARSFIFSTAPMPACSAAAIAGIKIIQSEEGNTRLNLLRSLLIQLKTYLLADGWQVPDSQSAIIPLILGGNQQAISASNILRECGIYVPAIRFPTVPKNTARLRITVTANHTAEDVRGLALAINSILNLRNCASENED